MKVEVRTTHDLSIVADDLDGAWFQAKVDNQDSVVQLKLPGSVTDEDENRVQIRWVGRDDLLALRALINKALDLLP